MSPESPPSLLSYSPTNTISDVSGLHFDLVDLELLHLYSTTTYSCLAEKVPDIWRVEIPHLALSHPFLMHGVLAVTALHLAHLDPRRANKLTARASKHEDLALPHFRENTSGITERNCHAIFAFSGLVTTYVIATIKTSDYQHTIPSNDSWLPNWINLIRGSHSLLYTHWGWLVTGPFAPVMERQKSAIDYANNPNDAHLSSLLPLLSPSASMSAERREILATCEEALDQLRRVWALPYSECKTLGHKAAVTIWPGHISPQYIRLLRERKPEALVVLAHYCVLLSDVENCWYFNELAQHLLSAIRQYLSSEWHTWIQWPCDRVRTIDKS